MREGVRRVVGSLKRFPLSLLVVLVMAIALFLLVHEHELAGFDPASFVLAMKYDYSVDAARPHPPGYPAFYLLWSAIRMILGGLSPHSVLLAANLLFSILSLILIHHATRRLFDERTAGLATILTASNLLFLYYGSVGEMYVYDAAFSAFIVILLLTSTGRTELFLFVLYGILGSFRLSSVILTVPSVAAVQVLRGYRTRQVAPLMRNGCAFVLGMLIWLIPFVIYLHGWDHFWRLFLEASNPHISLSENLAGFAGTTLWMIGAPGLLAVIKTRRHPDREWDMRTVNLLLIIIPPAIFFAFRYVVKGYELLLLGPLVMLCAQALRSVRTSTISLVVFGNVLLFFFAPYIPPSIRSVLNHRSRTENERVESVLLRYTSVLAPTFAHISVSDDAMVEAKRLMASLPVNATVFVDNGAGLWAFPRSLQADFPTMMFLYPLATDSMQMKSFSGANTSDSARWTDLERLPWLYYLTDSGLVNEIGRPPGKLLLHDWRLALYTIPEDSILELRSMVNCYFTRHG